MTLTWSPDDLGYMLDFKEVVTLVKVSPDGGETEHAGATAIGAQEPERLVEAGDIQHVEKPGRWDVQASTLPAGVTVARGDRIVSTGLAVIGPATAMAGTWVVQEARLVTRSTRWECECIKALDT